MEIGKNPECRLWGNDNAAAVRQIVIPALGRYGRQAEIVRGNQCGGSMPAVVRSTGVAGKAHGADAVPSRKAYIVCG